MQIQHVHIGQCVVAEEDLNIGMPVDVGKYLADSVNEESAYVLESGPSNLAVL